MSVAVSLAMSRKEREEFLADLHIGMLSVADGENGPLTCPVWYRYEPGGDVVFVTGAASRKAAALRSAKRASFVAQTETLPYKYVSIEGPIVEIATADVDRDVRPIAQRYLGEEGGNAYIDATRAEHSDGDVRVRIRPARWLTVDYTKRFQAPA